jgi:hypothetical protein
MGPGSTAMHTGPILHSPFSILAVKTIMGLLTNIVFFPVTGPVAGIRWTLRKVAQVVDEELTDDTPIKQELMELQMQLELGDIDDAEYTRREAEVMKRLREVREWRERLGRGVSGGPVKVSAPAERAPSADQDEP